MKIPRITTTFAIAAIALAALPVQRSVAQPNDSLPSRAVLPTQIPSPQLPVAPSVAPGYRAPQSAPSAAQIIGVTQQPFVGIALQDAIAMALLKNPNLAVSASNVRIARYTIVEVKGAYDVQLQLKPSSNFSVQPPQNGFEAGPGTLGRYTPTPGPGPHAERYLYDWTRQHHSARIRLPVRHRRPNRERHDVSGRHTAEPDI